MLAEDGMSTDREMGHVKVVPISKDKSEVS